MRLSTVSLVTIYFIHLRPQTEHHDGVEEVELGVYPEFLASGSDDELFPMLDAMPGYHENDVTNRFLYQKHVNELQDGGLAYFPSHGIRETTNNLQSTSANFLSYPALRGHHTFVVT